VRFATVARHCVRWRSFSDGPWRYPFWTFFSDARTFAIVDFVAVDLYAALNLLASRRFVGETPVELDEIAPCPDGRPVVGADETGPWSTPPLCH
jgi:hypothetical protein